METLVFINLPVKDLSRTREFFSKLGYTFNSQFSDENALCMKISDTIFAMLLLENFYKTFISKEICDSSKASETIITLMVGSRGEVDDLADKALAAGAGFARAPEDFGFMYGRSFQDLDGHLWEIGWMDPDHVQQQ